MVTDPFVPIMLVILAIVIGIIGWLDISGRLDYDWGKPKDKIDGYW